MVDKVKKPADRQSALENSTPCSRHTSPRRERGKRSKGQCYGPSGKRSKKKACCVNNNYLPPPPSPTQYLPLGCIVMCDNCNRFGNDRMMPDCNYKTKSTTGIQCSDTKSKCKGMRFAESESTGCQTSEQYHTIQKPKSKSRCHRTNSSCQTVASGRSLKPKESKDVQKSTQDRFVQACCSSVAIAPSETQLNGNVPPQPPPPTICSSVQITKQATSMTAPSKKPSVTPSKQMKAPCQSEVVQCPSAKPSVTTVKPCAKSCMRQIEPPPTKSQVPCEMSTMSVAKPSTTKSQAPCEMSTVSVARPPPTTESQALCEMSTMSVARTTKSQAPCEMSTVSVASKSCADYADSEAEPLCLLPTPCRICPKPCAKSQVQLQKKSKAKGPPPQKSCASKLISTSEVLPPTTPCPPLALPAPVQYSDAIEVCQPQGKVCCEVVPWTPEAQPKSKPKPRTAPPIDQKGIASISTPSSLQFPPPPPPTPETSPSPVQKTASLSNLPPGPPYETPPPRRVLSESVVRVARVRNQVDLQKLKAESMQNLRETLSRTLKPGITGLKEYISERSMAIQKTRAEFSKRPKTGGKWEPREFVDYFVDSDGLRYIGILEQIQLDFEERCKALLVSAKPNMERNAKQLREKLAEIAEVEPVYQEKLISEFDFPTLLEKELKVWSFDWKSKITAITRIHKFGEDIATFWSKEIGAGRKVDPHEIYDTGTQTIAELMTQLLSLMVKACEYLMQISQDPKKYRNKVSIVSVVDFCTEFRRLIVEEIGAIGETCGQVMVRIPNLEHQEVVDIMTELYRQVNFADTVLARSLLAFIPLTLYYDFQHKK